MPEYFYKNIERWSLFCPAEANLVKELDCQRVFFSQQADGERTLYQQVNGEMQYYHPQGHAVEESQKWLASLDLKDATVLFVFGVGLGYYYHAAKEWLKNTNHFLVFIEHDLEVIHRLLETEIGEAILNDPQVRLQYFDSKIWPDEVWRSLAKTFGVREYKHSALAYYAQTLPDIEVQIEAHLAFWTNLFRAVAAEYHGHGRHFFLNFYQNLLQLPHAYQAHGLFDKFPLVPAIICGAGPSLDKNLALVEHLADRAVIIAGGTAMNAVNSNGFCPHFGVGIDPHEEQMSRIIMNTAYETPFLYRARLNPGALKLVQGQTLYVNGTSGYEIAHWYENELGIAGKDVNEGFNVVNFSIALAQSMGCNPIIFVGVDLAYTNRESYQSGVVPHPTHTRKYDFRTKSIQEELLIKNDIYGNPTHTLWKWIAESFWIARFAWEHPNVFFINATEGGIGMPGIVNKPLSEVVDHLLHKQFDLNVQIHGHIQNSHMPSTVTVEKIKELTQGMEESLVKCQALCEKVITELQQVEQDIKTSNQTTDNFLTEAAEEAINEMSHEKGYQWILFDFDSYFQDSIELDLQQLKYHPEREPYAQSLRRVQLKIRQYQFLQKVASVNSVLMRFLVMQGAVVPMKESSASTVAQPKEETGYSFKDYKVTIVDPDLKLNYQETTPLLDASKAYTLLYPNGAKRYEQYYLNGKLHGPVSFFSESGQLLARSWYINGIQQGKAWYYYHTGEIYSIQRFHNGSREGNQLYYYPHGNLKTSLTYIDNQLDGDVWLYFANGAPKREVHFVKGKRQGIDRLWNEAGQLILEAEYSQNQPVGNARTWHPNGRLAQEAVYNSSSQLVSIQGWDEQGKPISVQKILQEDYFDTVAKKTQELTRSLENIFSLLSQVLPTLDSSLVDDTMKDDMQKLQKDITHLQEMHEELLKESGLTAEHFKEPIWKTPLSKHLLEKQLEEVTKRMTEEVTHIQQILVKAIQRVAEKKMIENNRDPHDNP